MAKAGPGDMHEVKLTWHGFIEMTGKRMTPLRLDPFEASMRPISSTYGTISATFGK